MSDKIRHIAGQSAGKLVLRLLLAFAALLSMRVSIEIVGGLETESPLVNIASRVPNSFSAGGLPELVLFAALFLLISYVGDSETERDGRVCVLSAVMALLLYIAKSSTYLGGLSFFFANPYQLCLSLFCVFGCAVWLYPVLTLVFRSMEKSGREENKTVKNPQRTAFLWIAAGLLPWILMNYPCSFCPDSTGQLGQWLGIDAWSAHHPPFSTLIMGLCVSAGKALWNINFGCFLYVLLQTLFGAFVFSLGLAELYRMGLSRRMYIILLLFFAASPFWGCYAQWFEKDLLYAEVFALDLVLVLRVLNKGECSRKDAVCIAVTTLAAVLLRKTGLYELIPALAVLVFVMKRDSRRRLACAVAAAFLLSGAVNNLLYPALGIEEASVAEALSIPFQQTARYVNSFPEEVTPEEREAIDAVLDFEKLGEYEPEVSDFIKTHFRGDSSALPAYFKTWFGMFLKHPRCYFEAFFDLCSGYIAPVRTQLDGYILINYYPVLNELGIHRVFHYFPTYYFSCLRECFLCFPVTALLCMAGTFTWISMACFVQLLRHKEYKALILLIPAAMNILVSIASPLCAATRYALPTIAVSPLIVGWTVLRSKQRPIVTGEE